MFVYCVYPAILESKSIKKTCQIVNPYTYFFLLLYMNQVPEKFYKVYN
jgi:hypothetical protein